jgi:dTDP-4-dehydrorhamnose 3,5-epimerase
MRDDLRAHGSSSSQVWEALPRQARGLSATRRRNVADPGDSRRIKLTGNGARVTPLDIHGAYVIEPARHPDARGEFLEWYSARPLRAALGRPVDIAQANLSVSRRGVLRGVHLTRVPPGQGKLVTCVAGAALDAVVDLRVGSPTFGRHALVRLDPDSRTVVWIPEGLGHAFLALEDGTTVTYLCTTGYDPASEVTVNALDAELAIEWPLQDCGDESATPIRSERDAAAPSLAQVLASGALPLFRPI